MMEKQIAKFPEAESVDIALEIRRGSIHKEILKTQRENNVDLIVIAPHRKTASLRHFFGGVTEKIKKQAQCSVLVVGA